MTNNDADRGVDIFDEYDVYSDDEDDADSILYDPDDTCNTRYNIILCELYNTELHGETNDELLKTSYLVYCRFKKLDMEYIEDYVDDFNAYYLSLINNNSQCVTAHSVFRNYKNIILKQPYIKTEIAQCVYLENLECVAILKTFWIKLIQRTWKNILQKRNYILKKRANIISLKHRELTGRWPNDCINYPELRGMLSDML
jgi:hypothetical protein